MIAPYYIFRQMIINNSRIVKSSSSQIIIIPLLFVNISIVKLSLISYNTKKAIRITYELLENERSRKRLHYHR